MSSRVYTVGREGSDVGVRACSTHSALSAFVPYGRPPNALHISVLDSGTSSVESLRPVLLCSVVARSCFF